MGLVWYINDVDGLVGLMKLVTCKAFMRFVDLASLYEVGEFSKEKDIDKVGEVCEAVPFRLM